MTTYRTDRSVWRSCRISAVILLTCVMAGTDPAKPMAGPPETGGASSRFPPLMIDTDMGRPVLYLINTETDALITVDLTLDAGFPGGLPLHTLLTPDGTHAYVTMMGSEQHPLRILVLRITSLDWSAGTAQMTITNVAGHRG